MAILKCKMCGGDIEVNEEKTFGTCEYCGSVMTLPKESDDQRAARFNRGNHFRRQGEFDKALGVYESIVREDDADAEAHWCCALCRFGIEYVEDPNTFEFLPTCHRASFDSFLEDVDYLAALENSDGITRRQYQKDAAKIAEVQRGILATSQNEEPFDVFICYKETDDSTKERTRDSLDAQDIYYQLTQAGYRVFFSRITLEDKVGAEYEPYIFAALNSAKVMVAIGSKPDYFNAVWVKNEWSRFLAMMRKDRSKLLIPCYKGMDPYDMPEKLGVLQSYDMAKIGFMQDLIRGIKKVLRKDEPKETVKEKVVVQQTGGTNIAPLLKRAFMYLEDGDWKSADEYAERVLDQDPENAEAYVGKLMAELHVRRREDLDNQKQPFDGKSNFKKAVRFGDAKTKDELNGYITHINTRNKNAIYDRAVNAMKSATTENDYLKASKTFKEIPGWKAAEKLANECLENAESARKNAIYDKAVSVMDQAKTEAEYKNASEIFKTIPEWKDANKIAKVCLEKAEIARKDTIYYNASNIMNAANTELQFNDAADKFNSISGWKDSDSQAEICLKKIEELKAKDEAERFERERQAEQERIANEKAAKKRKKKIKIFAAIGISAVCVLTAFLIALNTVLIPKSKYDKALELFNAGKYEEAIPIFVELNGFKDSNEIIKKYQPYSVVEYKVNDDGTAEIAGVTDTSTNDIFMVTKYDGHTVTSIGDSALSVCRNLASVTIPNSVTYIGSSAFYACSSLTTVTIPDTVTNIGDGAFSACSSLTAVTIPDSVTNIGYGAFSSCSKLTSVTIPDSVTSIGDFAFSSCRSLTSVNIPKSVTYISDSAFVGCSNLSTDTLQKIVAINPDALF